MLSMYPNWSMYPNLDTIFSRWTDELFTLGCKMVAFHICQMANFVTPSLKRVLKYALQWEIVWSLGDFGKRKVGFCQMFILFPSWSPLWNISYFHHYQQHLEHEHHSTRKVNKLIQIGQGGWRGSAFGQQT